MTGEADAMVRTPSASGMMLPNFIIAGAPKCGTTALFRILARHPEVGMSRVKEPRFFSEYKGVLERGYDDAGHKASGMYHNGLAWYESLFVDCNGYKAVGEASTNYFSYQDSPRLIRRHLPGARLIFMLRDPVQRMYSHYWQERKAGWPLPAFDQLVERRLPRARYYEAVSGYAHHLVRFLDLFPREQILVLLQEDFVADPRARVRDVLNFLGVGGGVADEALSVRYNRQSRPRSRRLEWLINRARWLPAYDALPLSARQLLRRMRAAISRANAVPFEYPPLRTETRRLLVPRFGADVTFVEQMLDRELPAWRV